MYHLAALLSTRSEFTPVTAHQVNVEGTLNLLEFAQREAESHGRPVLFLYPSSIAAYGLPDLETKRRAGRVHEDDYNTPSTMYGCNKLYCEQLGRYYARFYKQLAAEPQSGRVDFRCGALSGLDFGDDGALGRHLRLRAGDDSRRGERRALRLLRAGRTRGFRSWPCPTGSQALLALAAAPRERLTRTAYNLSAFSPSAEEIRTEVLQRVPRCADHLDDRHAAAGHRRFVAGRRR